MANQPPEPDKLKFDQAMQQLEHLVEQIESGEIELEQALQQYERGMALIKRCRSILDQAEHRVAELTANEQGQLEIDADETETPAPPDADTQDETA